MQSTVETTLLGKTAFALIGVTVVLTALLYGTVHPPIIALFYGLVVLTVIVAAADALIVGRLRLSKSAVQVPLLLAAAYALVQVIPFGTVEPVAGVAGIPRTISQDPFWTLVFAVHAVFLSVFLVLCLSTLASPRRIGRMAMFVAVFGFVFAFFAIIQSFLSPEKIYGIYESAYARPFGSFVNRHNFAAYIEMCIALPLGLLMQGAVGRDKRLLYVTMTVIMAVALLMSGSRGGVVALGSQVVMLLILFRSRLMEGRLWVKAVLGIVLVSVVVVGAAYIGSETSMSRLSETAQSGDFSAKRTRIWSSTLGIIGDNVLLGSGFGAFGTAYAAYDSGNGLERVEQAHNDYLQTLSDGGSVGAAIGLSFLILVVRSGLRLGRIRDKQLRGAAVGAFVGVFGVLVHSLFDFVLHTTAVSVLFLVLIAILNSSISEEWGDGPGASDSETARADNVKSINDRGRGA